MPDLEEEEAAEGVLAAAVVPQALSCCVCCVHDEGHAYMGQHAKQCTKSSRTLTYFHAGQHGEGPVDAAQAATSVEME